MRLKKALLVVDVQNDFCPGGALGIKGGDKIIPTINKYIKIFLSKRLPIFVTRDWHPKTTTHFKRYGGVWPKHCVQDTEGARFHPRLIIPKEAIMMSKGMDPSDDSYSAFHAVDSNNTGLLNLLKIFGVNEIFIGGLATDYCVKYSTWDAVRSGLKVNILVDAIKGVDLKPGDSESAIEEMVSHGARKVTFEKLSKAIS